MELTAIKSLGKNKRDNRKAAVAARKPLNRPSGRPFKLPDPREDTQSSTSSEPHSKKTKKKSLRNIKSRRKMSDLEKLPVEILETIFLFCLNLDLPNASPVVAGKLSSSITYTKTVLAAFGPTWEKWHGRERSRLDKRNNSGPEDPDQDPVLQSAILRCRWATLPVVLNSKDTWIRRYGQNRSFKPSWFVVDQDPPAEDAEDQDSSQITAREYLDIDFQKFSDLILSQRDGGWLWDQCSWDLNSDVADGIEIPPSLLSGTWDEDMLKYLFWLRKSGAGINWYNSTGGEKAITTGDIRAIHLLCWTGIIDKLDVDLLIWAFRNAGGDKLAVISQLLRLNFGVMQDREARKIDKELSEMMDEARQEGDNERVELAVRISTSETLDGRLETVRGSSRLF